MDSSHEKIIKYIDEHRKVKFAIWEVSIITQCNPRTVTRVLTLLRKIKLVGKMPRGYNYKYWEVTKLWKSASDTIAKYEIAYVMRDEI